MLLPYFYQDLFSFHFLRPILASCLDASATFLCRFYLWFSYKFYSRQRIVSYSSRCSSKYHLRTLEKVVGPKRSLALHLRLLWLPWIVALLILPFVSDLQRIPLPPNPITRPPFSYTGDLEELNRNLGKVNYNCIYSRPPRPKSQLCAGTPWWLDIHMIIPV